MIVKFTGKVAVLKTKIPCKTSKLTRTMGLVGYEIQIRELQHYACFQEEDSFHFYLLSNWRAFTGGCSSGKVYWLHHSDNLKMSLLNIFVSCFEMYLYTFLCIFSQVTACIQKHKTTSLKTVHYLQTTPNK